MPRTLAGCIAVSFLFCVGMAQAGTLEEELYKVDQLRSGRTTPFDKVESRCAELLQIYKDPNDQAKIYFELAQVEGQSGMQHPDKLIGYIEKGLSLPLDPVKRARLYIYWGDLLMVSHPGAHGKDLAVARKEATMPYLNGLKDMLQHDLPEAKPKLPGVMVINSSVPDDPKGKQQYQAMLLEQQKRLEAYEKAKFQEQMIEYRDVMNDQIASMYSRLPFDTNNLETLAKDVLKDDVAVNRLMAKVRARVQERVDALGPVPRDLPKDLPNMPSSARSASSRPTSQGAGSEGATGPGKSQGAQVASAAGSPGGGNLAVLILAAVALVSAALTGSILRRRRRARYIAS
jgi:hypothetical protein